MSISKSNYAKQKNVAKSQISYLIKKGRLATIMKGERQEVIDCKHNDDLFLNPSHRAKRK